jgi:mRNA interferase HigB
MQCFLHDHPDCDLTETALAQTTAPSKPGGYLESSSLTIRLARIQFVFVRIIKETFLVQAAKEYPKAASYLDTWRKIVKAAAWQSLLDVRRAYPSADSVRIESGRQVFIFNVCGNDFRLLVAIHFNRQIVFTLRFMTHAEYSRGKWKETL